MCNRSTATQMLLPCVWLSTSLYFFTLQWYIVKLTLGFISLRPWQTANRLKCGLKSELNWETLIFTSVMWTVWSWGRSVFHILGVAPLTGPVAKTPQLSEDQGQQTTVGRVLLDNTHFSMLFPFTLIFCGWKNNEDFEKRDSSVLAAGCPICEVIKCLTGSLQPNRPKPLPDHLLSTKIYWNVSDQSRHYSLHCNHELLFWWMRQRWCHTSLHHVLVLTDLWSKI